MQGEEIIAASSACRLAPGGLLGWTIEFEEQLLVQLIQLALGGGRKEFGRHLGEHPVIAHGMITEGLAESCRHQSGVTGFGHQVFQAAEKFTAAGRLGVQTDPDATTQRDQFFPAQFFGEPGISGEEDTEQALGIEAGTGQQAQFAEHRGIYLLGFVDEQHRAAAGGLQMGEPALAQGLEAAPAVTGFEGDGKDISQFPEKSAKLLCG